MRRRHRLLQAVKKLTSKVKQLERVKVLPWYKGKVKESSIQTTVWILDQYQNGGLNIKLPFGYWTSEYQTSENLLFICFCYSDIRNSDPHWIFNLYLTLYFAVLQHLHFFLFFFRMCYPIPVHLADLTNQWAGKTFSVKIRSILSMKIRSNLEAREITIPSAWSLSTHRETSHQERRRMELASKYQGKLTLGEHS